MSALLDIESSAAVPTVLPDIGRVTLPQYTPKVLSGVMYIPAPPLESVSLKILIPDLTVVFEGAVALIRSLTNQALFELPEAPRLPLNPWDSRIQSLIDLERELDSRLIERYHALAASTLAGLSEEERARVTRRVELDEEAFLIDKADERDR